MDIFLASSTFGLCILALYMILTKLIRVYKRSIRVNAMFENN